jgi:hypothetical protein
MDPLSTVEETLKHVSEWPAYIRLPMFLLNPEDHVVRDIAAFFYGNNIDAENAWKCYYACNGSGDDETLIREGVKRYYAEWTGSEVKTVPYYNVKTKKFVRINGDINSEIPDTTIMLHGIRRVRDYQNQPKTVKEEFDFLNKRNVMKLCMLRNIEHL